MSERRIPMFSLIPWRKKEQPIARLRGEFESLFDRFLSRWPAPFDAEYGFDTLWGLDVEDRDNEILVRAEVPGFEAEELDVQLSNRILTIKAKKKLESKNNGNGSTEEYRSYHRSVTVPEGIKADGIEAKYRNGVLEIRLPKTEEARPKRIPVQA
jgi:HSP20 family protein